MITPKDNEDDDEDATESGDRGKSHASTTGLRKIIDQKFKEMDAFMNKKVLKNLMGLSTDTGTKLD